MKLREEADPTKPSRAAALINASKLAQERTSWRHVFQLGFAAVAFALLDVASAIREQKQ